ncbi:uncharacterized protein B0P05DRAFT_273933 [Gilbertella persicaria]|uniref:uncharacterized protein n=1 Tax=Gilbertella persicaria TaxID=101096 RepID=UPI002220BB25|nr:uncharacterized protein B0P05DRAFT_273933 [Gilbertella persicaria]KAI8059040.1 hypothetical protein B0P05DRAFT_273933 [Gilbertella persicaria]
MRLLISLLSLGFSLYLVGFVYWCCSLRGFQCSMLIVAGLLLVDDLFSYLTASRVRYGVYRRWSAAGKRVVAGSYWDPSLMIWHSPVYRGPGKVSVKEVREYESVAFSWLLL